MWKIKVTIGVAIIIFVSMFLLGFFIGYILIKLTKRIDARIFHRTDLESVDFMIGNQNIGGQTKVVDEAKVSEEVKSDAATNTTTHNEEEEEEKRKSEESLKSEEEEQQQQVATVHEVQPVMRNTNYFQMRSVDALRGFRGSDFHFERRDEATRASDSPYYSDSERRHDSTRRTLPPRFMKMHSVDMTGVEAKYLEDLGRIKPKFTNFLVKSNRPFIGYESKSSSLKNVSGSAELKTQDTP